VALPRLVEGRESMGEAAADGIFGAPMLSFVDMLVARLSGAGAVSWHGVAMASSVSLLAGAALFRTAKGSWKARDGTVLSGGQTPERLRVFADWAHQQVSECSPEMHRQIIDDVIYTFATYAQRLDRETSREVRKAAELRLRVLVDLLETPSMSSALRRVNWAWVRDWELGSLDRREARLRCTVILPTICAAAAVQRTDRRRRSWIRSTPSSPTHGGPQNVEYLAAWAADFLERPDVRGFLGLALGRSTSIGGSGKEAGPSRRTQLERLGSANYSFIGEGALYSDSDTDEDTSPRTGGDVSFFGGSPVVANQGGPNENGSLAAFCRREYEGQEHCWDVPDSTSTRVRGPNYLTDRIKVQSKSSMLELVEVDLVKTFDEIVHYGVNPRGKVLDLREKGDSRFFFVMNFRLVPIQLCVVWAVPKDASWGADPEGVLFERFLAMTTEQRSTRLKVIPKVLEGPWLVKQGVPERPGVVGKKLACEYFMRPDHLEFSVNCISSPAGRRIVQLLTGAARHFSMELSIVLEGQAQDELPERVLGGLSVYKGDLTKLIAR